MRVQASLDGTWRYWIDRDSATKETMGFDEITTVIPPAASWKPCHVPCCWNVLEPDLMRFFGTGFFARTFAVPPGKGSDRIVLRFGAANYRCSAWVNGREAGSHDGGYTSFAFDITTLVHDPSSGRTNELLVRVDNAWGHGDRLPWCRLVDWFNYGGIHGHVLIERVPSPSIAGATIRTDLGFEGDAPSPSRASMDIHVDIDAGQGCKDTCTVTVQVVKRGGSEVIATATRATGPLPAGTTGIDLQVAVVDPARLDLWSPDHPALHDTRITLETAGGMVDARSWATGFRKVETRGTAFYVNNRRFFMLGTNRHVDHPDTGLAVPDAIHFHDLLIMKEANINCFRGSHYPNPAAVLDACDELGLFFIEEIPGWQLQDVHYADPGLLGAAKSCFDEMHARDANHPCIIAWSMSNECATDTAKGRKYHEALYAHARAIDKGQHLVIHVSNRKAMDRCYDLADFITINTYEGWYGGGMGEFVHHVDLIHEIMMDEDRELGEPKPIVLTEFGAGAIRGYRSRDKARWSEDFQAGLLRFYITECMKRDFVGGTWTWMFCDTRVDLPTRPDGRPRSYNNKGMIDEHRIEKLAYMVVRDLYGVWKAREGAP